MNLFANFEEIYKRTFDVFLESFHELENQFHTDSDKEKYTNNLRALASSYKQHTSISSFFITHGKELIDNCRRGEGLLVIRVALDVFCDSMQKVALYLGWAVYSIESGQQAKGESYLYKICFETVDNFEESIEWQELTSVWQCYRPLVAHCIKPQINYSCQTSLNIEDILDKSGEDMLSLLSEHLYELSDNGERLNMLNKWERTVLYADVLLSEVHSGGFEAFLSYNGHRFEQTKAAIEAMGAEKTLKLMDKIQSKFPKTKIPKKQESINKVLEKLEQQNITFDTEDEFFYTKASNEIIGKLEQFVVKNKKRFR